MQMAMLSIVDSTPLIHCRECGAAFHTANRHMLYTGEGWARCKNWVRCRARQRGINRPLGRQFLNGG